MANLALSNSAAVLTPFIAMAKNYDLVVDHETAEMYKNTWRAKPTLGRGGFGMLLKQQCSTQSEILAKCLPLAACLTCVPAMSCGACSPAAE